MLAANNTPVSRARPHWKRAVSLSLIGAAAWLTAAGASLAGVIGSSQNSVGSDVVPGAPSATSSAPASSGPPPLPGVPLPPASSTDANSLKRFDAVYGLKGWDIGVPSYADTLLQDYGGWRSALASQGLGIFGFNQSLFADNLLDTPRGGPTRNPYYGTNQTYNGQKFSALNTFRVFLTYDVSRLGLQGGQLQLGACLCELSTYQSYSPKSLSFNALAYYQPLFNNRLEIRIGVFPLVYDFVGQFVAGTVVSATGVSGTLPTLLGLTASTAVSPAAQFKFNITDSFYDEFAVSQSAPVTGGSGNSYFDGVELNPIGLSWRFNVPGTRQLYIDELGYKAAPAPGTPSTWVRLGGIYNSSDFHDYSKLSRPGGASATKSGNGMIYFLADRQVLQDPILPARGIYAGASAMYAPPSETATSQYYELRAYWVGPFAARPSDLATVAAFHQVNSSYLVDFTNANSAHSGSYGARTQDGIALLYQAHLTHGLYVQIGPSYNKNPTVTYFGPSIENEQQRFQGNSFAINAGIVSIF
jgi:porin